MRNQAYIELAKRREVLIAQCDRERNELAQLGTPLGNIAQVIYKFRNSIRHFKNHPLTWLLPLIPIAITLVLRSRRILVLGISGIQLWKLLRTAIERSHFIPKDISGKLSVHGIDKIRGGIRQFKNNPGKILLLLIMAFVLYPGRLLTLGISGLRLLRFLQGWRR